MKQPILVFNAPKPLFRSDITHVAVRSEADIATEGRCGNRFEIIVEAGNLKREYCEKTSVRQ